MRNTCTLILLLLFIFTIAESDDFITIKTPNGQVRGIKSSTENNKTFFAFRGMRYAQPPIGDLRFRSPLPALNWTGVYNATENGNNCIQIPVYSNTNEGNEDCLFINVFTTQLNNGSLLPVLVYIHGGVYLFETGNMKLHNVDKILNYDVIFVSFNFRLGVLGFLCTEDENIPGNYGLKDQILALKWIQQNIASFGGDPKKVTIFGNSAGATSVHYLRQAKNTSHLFQRSIANSGTTLNAWSFSLNARHIAFEIGSKFGIRTGDSKILLDQLRKINSVALSESIADIMILKQLDPLNGFPFAPCLEKPSNESVYTEYSYEAQKKGHVHSGELLLGFNSMEGREYGNLPMYPKFIIDMYNKDSSKLTPLSMKASNYGKQIVGKNILFYYFRNETIKRGPELINFVTDNSFVRGIVKSAQLQSHHSNVYLYQYSFIESATHKYYLPEGATHAEEMQYFLNEPEFVQINDAARLTEKRILQMWTDFAKTGNPTPKPTKDVNVTWPLVNATGYKTIYYLDIGKKLVLSKNPKNKALKFWEIHFTKYGNPPYNTY